jgi:hypothetical protein
MAPRTLYLVNRSTLSLITDDWRASFAAALAGQIRDDFAPAWGLAPWAVGVLAASDVIPADGVELAFFDDSDAPGLAGYHDKSPTGAPYGKVFVAGCTLDQIEQTASHEGLELPGNLEADTCVLGTDGVIRVRESCDPVEDMSYPRAGLRGQHAMSDFVLPTWFEPETPAGVAVDFLGKLTGPGTKTDGGYFLTVDPKTGAMQSNPPGALARAGKSHATSRPMKIARKLTRAMSARVRAA